MNDQERAEFEQRIRELEQEVERLKRENRGRIEVPEAGDSGDTVSVPAPFKPIFDQAQKTVSTYFEKLHFMPSKGLIEVSDERYVLIRASSLAHDFFEHIRKLYSDRDAETAFETGRDFLFDIGHVLGMEDAKCFHKKMNLLDPIEKLSAGPVHFAWSGWAFVDILAESSPTPDENFFLKYHHPYSFEADSWLSKGQLSPDSVCIMNAAYSSGWCEQSFGIPLTAVEIQCRAKGDDNCTFVMAHPDKIKQHLEKELLQRRSLQRLPETPLFFNRKSSQDEIRASQEKIRVQERHWQGLTTNTDDIIMVLDSTDRIQYLNRSSSQLPVAEQLGRSVYEKLTPAHVKLLRKTIVKAKKLGTPQSFEISVAASSADGRQQMKWYNTKIISFSDSDTQSGAIMVVTDISRRKQSENVVIKSQFSLNEAQKLAKIGSWEFDLLTSELTWSQEQYRIFELEAHPGETLYQAYRDKYHPEDLPRLDQAIQRAVETGEGFNFEHRIICKDGSIKHILSLGETVRNAEGAVIGLKGTGQDITERKQIEANLEQAIAVAKAANQAKNVFLAIMSHEIRTPLNGVLGMLQLLKFSPLDAEQRDMVEIAHHSGEMLLNLLTDLLDFSKIEAGRLELEMANFGLRRLVEDTVALQSATGQAKGLEINCRVEDDVPDQLYGDPTRLQQVLNNLFCNAVKFTEAGEVRVDVSLGEDEAGDGGNGPLICFAVSDTGIGVPPELREKIFEPFTQGDSTITRKYDGSGLGLPLCQRLVTAMGGQIGVVNRPGGGSIFFFSVQLELAHAPLTEPAAPQPAVGTSQPQASARILVVEDNLVNQMVATRMLQQLGFQADVASDGEQGLQALAGHPYDLVLMDMMMPVLDGVDATRRLRAGESAGTRLPVIAMTANISENDREACLAAGMDDFLPKPIALDAMKAILARWLGAGESAAAAATAAPAHDDSDLSAVLKREVLVDLREFLRDNYREMLNTFFAESAQSLIALREAGTRGYRDLLMRQAHSLKGSCGNFGSVELYTLCSALQDQATTLSADEVLKAVTEVEQAYHRLKDALEDDMSTASKQSRDPAANWV